MSGDLKKSLCTIGEGGKNKEGGGGGEGEGGGGGCHNDL